jgi:uncharacterized protein YggU (UPF0235/DUF167 family)
MGHSRLIWGYGAAKPAFHRIFAAMVLCVNVKPNQRFDRIEATGDGTAARGPQWTIRIREAALDGRANAYLVAYLGEILGLPRTKISLKRGLSSRIKWIEIDADAATVSAALARHAGRGD